MKPAPHSRAIVAARVLVAKKHLFRIGEIQAALHQCAVPLGFVPRDRHLMYILEFEWQIVRAHNQAFAQILRVLSRLPRRRR